MRLSLRTLLAFEDNVFDVEQHRRLEQLLPADKNAEATLRRIRSIVRNPSLGVPGLVDHQEELDPNYVAEYLDHQMSGSVQEKFETYCLSADKYLAEIAAIHHILSNVLGEPARTSRECRLRCYSVLADTTLPAFSAPEPSAFFQPYDAPPQPKADKPTRSRYFASLWKRLFPVETAPAAPAPAVPEEKRPPLWTFTILGLFACALLLGWQQIGWQQIEKHRLAQQPFDVEVEVAAGELGAAGEPGTAFLPFAEHCIFDETDIAKSIALLEPFTPLEPIEQVAYAAEVFTAFTVAPADDAIAVSSQELANFEPLTSEEIASDEIASEDEIANENGFVYTTITESIRSEELPMATEEETIVVFQPIISPARSTSEFAISSNAQNPSTSQSIEQPTGAIMSSMQQPVSIAAVQQPLPNPPPITQMSATAMTSNIVGRAAQTSPSSLIFSAASPDAPWLLLPLPFELKSDQYLLTAAPFRGTFELADSFRIEMVGDAKLCILPPDASGVPGIFVDYGRIIIYPLQANQPLRIEMEKARGTVSSTGTESVLFIDTFAEISESMDSSRSTEEQGSRTSPILGFVPRNGERIAWRAANQPQPFFADTQGSVLLQSDRYRFGEVRNLPNWLGAMPVSPEDRMLAEVCRRYFAEAQGNGEQALTQLIQDESPAVRTLGLRLWGDLGRFDVPIAAAAERRQGEEAIRHVLNQYFEEVMRRDGETIQRFADAIQSVREAQRN